MEHNKMSDAGQILIADDNNALLLATSTFLRSQGYMCDCAPDAKTVIEMLIMNKYSLLISDINMPGNMNLELIDEIPKISEDMPVILMTGDPTLVPTIQPIQSPVVACLIKPVDFRELLEHVKISVEKKW